MEKLRNRWKGLSNSARVRILVLPAILAGGALASLWGIARNGDWDGMLLNLGTELIGAFVTFILLDWLLGSHEQREALARMIEQHKERLIRQLGSSVNTEAKRAAEELRAQGWLEDGSLVRIALIGADLEGVDLRRADLGGARFYRANLRGAKLTGANLENAILTGANLEEAWLVGANLQEAFLAGANLRGVKKVGAKCLAQARRLKGATMPDGDRYDGRFCLPGDLGQAKKNGVDIEDPAVLAKWYGVPLEVYERGQVWAQKNLRKLREG